MKRILTIAGSDSGGGAGIQADLKTITILGAYGASVITALTAQNTKGVQGIYSISPEFVGEQIGSVLSDIGADAIKTGMLDNGDIIDAVASKIRSFQVENVVVDPVLLAKGGAPLTRSEAIPALKEKLFPLALVITPNLEDASALAGFTVRDLKGMEKAARKLHSFGSKYVLVKGGHLQGDPVDILYDGQDFHHFTVERLITENTHGTGCTFSAALATFLAQGFDIVNAVAKAKYFVTLAIKASFALGKGIGPTNPFAYLEKDLARFDVLQKLDKALFNLKNEPAGKLIPEVQSNLVFALPLAINESEVAGFPGRIVALRDYAANVSGPEFGASHHMARLVLAIMSYNSEFRSAMNIRYDEEILRKCRRLKWKVASFDRLKEPPEIKEQEGASLKWGIREALKNTAKIPDVIYDRGDMGKEPMIRVLGRNPDEVVSKVLSLV